MSQNNLGVYGTFLLTNALKKNKTLKGLNLFKNTIDVDGARAVRELLKVNSTIEFLDLGHNRIREKGLEAITEGIQASKDCKLKTLGLRMNFINDDGFTRFFDESIFSGMSKIENLYIRQNNLTEYKAKKIQEKLRENKLDIFVDSFEKSMYISEERMERTAFVGLDNAAAQSNRIMESQFGLIKRPVRYREGKKLDGKNGAKNIYMFVEFEDTASVELYTKMVNRGRMNYVRKAFRSGTNTYVHIRRSKRP